MKFPMYKLIDDIKSYQKEFGKDPNTEIIQDWAENYAEEEKEFYYEKPCSSSLTFILYIGMYLLGVTTTLLFLSILL
jgi:hypothetical protein